MAKKVKKASKAKTEKKKTKKVVAAKKTVKKSAKKAASKRPPAKKAGIVQAVRTMPHSCTALIDFLDFRACAWLG